MDKLTTYRQLVEQILRGYADVINRQVQSEKETDVVFDEQRNHYMLVSVGWHGERRIRGTTVYVRLRNGKIWIEEDWLEHGIVPELLAAGVPKEDIVLGFQPPKMRGLTEFAEA